ncbi:MAG: small, acid-soluble spore protein, alpha/beta type [Dethiobacteria bacterium]|jgi:small acid-soluble spore protein F (minor alpha/beta-type SASP)
MHLKKKRKKIKSPPELEKERLKMEVAQEIGLAEEIKERGWENLTSRELGKIGGHLAQKKRRQKVIK